MTPTNPEPVERLIERLRARAKSERQYAESSTIVADLLEPQMALFNAREAPWNTYAVRMAVDHRNSAKKDAAFADDLDTVVEMLTRTLANGSAA